MEQEDNPILLTNLRQRIEATTELPSMPETAQALLRLGADPNGNINNLVEIVENDPSLAAQVMRYARSAIFSFPGEIHSLHQAITSVLGYQFTIDVCLGISLGKTFAIPTHGSMGLYPFWQHSVYSATLIERLIQIMPAQHRPHPGLGFLSGLLHNFGVLLVAHLFKQENTLLQQIIAANPDIPRTILERQVLGTDHMEIGAWLMRKWNLQPEIQVAVAEHHDEFYRGVHATYARLVLLTDRLLKQHNIGDAESEVLPEFTLSSLGLSQEQAETALMHVMSSSEDINILARQLAA